SLRKENILVFAPSKQAAQLEGSKIFAKEFMRQAGVPTAKAEIVTSVESTLLAATNYSVPYILKADGLAAGKGVFICADLSELKTAAENLFDKKILGDAGCRALLEQNLAGKEISFLVLTNGSEFQTLPLAQDHKRLLDNNLGPNTGGMGTIAPMQIEKELFDKIISKIVKPSIENLKKHNYLYRGVLFIGLMIVNNEPYVLEYNVRFGDPETQVILPLIENDISELFFELSKGNLQKISLNNKSSICIVNAAEGYPDHPVKGTPITLPADSDLSYILHAGTQLTSVPSSQSSFNSKEQLVSAGGRVLNVVAVHDNFTLARNSAYEINNKVLFAGRQFRRDIGEYK
ncbi:MAG: phosphoribosylamine--glycine ligase, partial [Bdellovibrionota bacterium]